MNAVCDLDMFWKEREKWKYVVFFLNDHVFLVANHFLFILRNTFLGLCYTVIPFFPKNVKVSQGNIALMEIWKLFILKKLPTQKHMTT